MTIFRLASDKVGNLDLHHIDIISKAVCMEHAHNEDSEPYTSDKLSSIPGGYTTLTPMFKIMDFDFNNPTVSQVVFRSKYRMVGFKHFSLEYHNSSTVCLGLEKVITLVVVETTNWEVFAHRSYVNHIAVCVSIKLSSSTW